MDGLTEKLQDKLAVLGFPNFQTLVDKAIVTEHKGRALDKSRKRNNEAQRSVRERFPRPRFGQPPMPHFQASPPLRPPTFAPHPP